MCMYISVYKFSQWLLVKNKLTKYESKMQKVDVDKMSDSIPDLNKKSWNCKIEKQGNAILSEILLTIFFNYFMQVSIILKKSSEWAAACYTQNGLTIYIKS